MQRLFFILQQVFSKGYFAALDSLLWVIIQVQRVYQTLYQNAHILFQATLKIIVVSPVFDCMLLEPRKRITVLTQGSIFEGRLLLRVDVSRNRTNMYIYSCAGVQQRIVLGNVRWPCEVVMIPSI